MNHTIEVYQQSSGQLKGLCWRNWYNPGQADDAVCHHRFGFRNGMVHVLGMNCDFSREVAEVLMKKWFAGQSTTYAFTTRNYVRPSRR